MEIRTLLKKLERFGAKSTLLPLDELKKILNTLEASTGPIPESYRAYLLHFGASVLFNINVVFKALQPSPWSDEQGNDTLESLYGLAESGKEYTVFEMADTYRNDFRDQWLPIGASSGDNQICLCLKGGMSGEIWFWDHESDPIFNDSAVISGLTKIANSFDEFVDMLAVQDDKIDTSGVIKIDLDF
ncbi:SMI1/KNR4 family protein [Enterobacter sp. WI-ESBL-E8]